jgi:endonuclease YncB( thermonuclease family)
MRIIIYCIAMLALAGPCRAFELSAVVVSVYDGDTITVDIPGVPPVFGDDVGVRVLGIDTPEMRGGTHDTRRLAVQARDQVRGWCPAGSVVTLHDVARDKYFRILARVECGGVDVAAGLLGLGLARPYDGGTKGGW